MPNNRHFDLLARWYDRAIHPPLDPSFLQQALDIPASGLLLDAGGGTGRIAESLCALVDRWVICDLSLPMLRQVHQKNLFTCSLWLSQARSEHLPFPDSTFARILVADAFHHFGDQPGAVREFVRVLQPGGLLVIEEPDIRRPRVKLIALAETLALMKSHFCNGDEISAMMSAHGLTTQVKDDRVATVWVTGRKS